MKFNEYVIGETYRTESIQLSKKDIIDFAKIYDPQYMHIDEAKAKEGRFGSLIASGMQTMSTSFKLWVELGIYGEDVIAGTGMNNIKFIKPVFPDDEINVLSEVIELAPRRSRGGIVTVLLTTFNQNNEKVFQAELSALISN
ncbi:MULTISPECIES: MaoC family dehydratase [Paenibacillus]|uniref:MaoC family dehydratase n=1 Tax=Paenibacillus TaxID=44249 RepID=UPI0007BF42DB|nr:MULTISPECIES: MaoC family dehydratase [Paenibacillus]MCZ1268262.1 MaoC family dehydratase [Paenibacillus tundrae]WDQ31386.1 MaoC family dehydratase [Paenibacillus marchantiae]SDK56540.1 Acyl dehydratase [Paenibacillus sp. OK060]SEA74458.1 Acyl dehydratase [Paenibacillus sp. 276b]SHN61979.1 Acyl dehydratase [Paenibacillus sp. ov031]